MSLVLDSSPSLPRDEAWPIFLETQGQAREIRLTLGEAIIYRGTKLKHWREALPEQQTATICFFHFVPATFDGSLA